MTGCITFARTLRLVSCVAFVATALFPNPSRAQDVPGIPTSIIAVPNAPLTITNCKSPHWYSNFATITNRTSHALLSVSVQVRYFDQDGTVIGQKVGSFNPLAPLGSGDDAIYDFEGGAALSEPESAITKVSCRIQEASFTGQKHWVLGQKWPEKLLPIKKQDAQNDQSGMPPAQTLASGPTVKMPAPPKISITVANAWNDANSGITIVHDSLVITGGDTDAQIRGNNFALTMTLANGSKKSFPGLMQQVPQYSKIDPRTGNAVMAYEVSPKEDLGALGAVIVPAHGTVRLTVSFIMQDVLANPGDNRAVAVQ